MRALADDEIHLWWLPWRPGDDRSALRSVLAGYLDVDPNDVRFAAGKHGKPSLQDPSQRLRFNWSHCPGLAVVALAYDIELGIDIEHAERSTQALAIARRWFASSELALLEALSGAERLRAFAAIWTVKEAVLKALGHGLNFGLGKVLVDLATDGMVNLQSIDGTAATAAAWQLEHPQAPAPGIASALAWQGGSRTLRGFDRT